MKKRWLRFAAALLALLWGAPALGQDVHMFWQTGSTGFAQWSPVSATNPLPVTASVSVTFPTIGAAVPSTGLYMGINVGGLLTGAVGGHGTAAGALRVELPTDGTGVIATVGTITNAVTVAQATAASLNATVVGTGTFVVQATLAAETTKVIGTVRNVGNVGGVLDAIGQNVAAPANWLQMGCQFNTTPTTVTTGNGSPCQIDNAGRLLVTLASAGPVAPGTAGTKSNLEGAVYTSAGVTLTDGQQVAAQANSVGARLISTLAADPCQNLVKTYTPISITTATTTRIVAPVASKRTYICYMLLTSAAADNVGIVEGTGGTCGSGTAGVVGGSTAANGPNFAANGGVAMGGGGFAVAATAGTNVDLCLITSAATPLAGHIAWVQAP